MFERLSIASLFFSSSSFSLSDFDPSLISVSEKKTFDPEMTALIDTASSALRELGAHIIYPFHEAYPDAFFALERPPLFLSVLGNLEILRATSRIAVVGSRELSHRSERWMENELGRFLRLDTDVVIISGGARGADQAAHLAAVRAGRPTIVFLPSGLNEVFPIDLKEWIDPILKAGGAVVSAYAPGDTIRNFRFEARNRLIASLSHLVFVTEAARRSGSIMTARLATELGRDVCVLPSFPGEVVGQGTLDLMINGAEPIRDAEDLLAMLNRARVQTSLSPRPLEAPSRYEGEQEVCKPHSDERRQLSLTSHALHNNIENIIADDEADDHNHPARADVPAICCRAEADAN